MDKVAKLIIMRVVNCLLVGIMFFVLGSFKFFMFFGSMISFRCNIKVVEGLKVSFSF